MHLNNGLIFCVAIFFSWQVSAEGLPSQKILTLDVARSLADAALEKCREDSYKVTIDVVDGADRPLVFLHDDGAISGSIELARMKASATIAFGRPSGPPTGWPASAPLPAPVIPGTSNLVGALVIMAEGELIGAIAVSGAPDGEKDAACAAAGLAKISSYLK